MKYSIILLLFTFLGLSSCNYLDVVPDERPTEADAFKDKNSAERFLYSCYSFMPKERQGANLYQTSEIAAMNDLEYLLGTYSAANVGNFTFWSRMYGGIRRCYTLLNNVDKVPHMEEELKSVYKAEAKFLIAYYHFILLKAYGPIILAKDEYALDIRAGEYPKRSHFDECVNWIVALYDEAFNDLLEKQATTYYGRATKTAAKALKGRLLLYAASPLFNGNDAFFGNSLKDPETGEALMSLTKEDGKWERAYIACLEAASYAEQNGYLLYEGVPTEELPYPSNATEWSLRMTFVDRNSSEVIWADPRQEGFYEYQNNATPRHPTDDGASWNNLAPTLTSVKMFYTENGLPIEEDPQYFTANQYYSTGLYNGRSTANLHLKREPRFYAWIAFQNGWYEMSRDGEKRIVTEFRNEDPHGKGNRSRNYSMSGYLVKKGVGLSYDTRNGYPNYPWPLIRLAELYLNIAEAAIESNKLDIGKDYLDKVRKRAGIPTVNDAWASVASLTKDKLRQVVRQERAIELFMEGQLGWDIKRWKVAEQYMGKNPKGMNLNGATDEAFFKETEIEQAWKFVAPKNYLLPIQDKEININNKLVQNPGY
ncbi:RagB/SusD family nutrient uptake outer membrane protein [Sphingobacterium lumbrici]|uniref:RagB/SusD family nutrient uptake outer membrane protein n=1 Tax=Sphingobacterium lumbrici TaxID=2559600 RepID=UPI001126A9CB|nr:RagB/SusD family nutrient uptake outer membrane protein [Sphingobacterium lumbrici]